MTDETKSYVLIDATFKTIHKIDAASRGAAVEVYLRESAEDNDCSMAELTYRKLLIAEECDFEEAFEAVEYTIKPPPKVEETVLLSFSGYKKFNWEEEE